MRKRILKSALFTKKPSHLILHVTNKCNLKCKTCFVDFTKNKKKELTLKEIEEIANYLNKLIWVDVSGGEPFLRKYLPDICSKFNTKSLSIPTNGYNPKLVYETTKKIRTKTKAEVTIAVSIDGFERTNDEIRNKGSFKKSIETLKLLRTIRGIKVKVNTVLCEKNYDEIIDFMKFIKKFNVDFHSIIFLRGAPRDQSFKCPPYEKLAKIKKDVFKIWAGYNYGFNTIEGKILQNYQKCLYNTSLRIIKEKKQLPKCLAGKHHLVIYPKGDVAFCELLKSFGNIRENSLETLLKSKTAEKQREYIKNKKCYCHHNCNMVDNYFLNPLHYPKLLKGVWKWTR